MLNCRNAVLQGVMYCKSVVLQGVIFVSVIVIVGVIIFFRSAVQKQEYVLGAMH